MCICISFIITTGVCINRMNCTVVLQTKATFITVVIITIMINVVWLGAAIHMLMKRKTKTNCSSTSFFITSQKIYTPNAATPSVVALDNTFSVVGSRPWLDIEMQDKAQTACALCKGTGFLICSTCNGCGLLPCYHHIDQNGVVCANCNGTCTVVCPRVEQCHICLGSGKLQKINFQYSTL